ncbi:MULTISPECIES: hypothetical protein [Pontibacillus]|uniref:Uncharacterized protein n=1 Tax=Pontibacillus chungwhensis TaxID=265426 RepID=A0ABY8V6J3_9BACI|nr:MULTISPECIES: hypothetical protein [Pontibacillus]WIF99476.1 hypothetical protein QNI29_07415 [Pontibacillus chungwhensis]
MGNYFWKAGDVMEREVVRVKDILNHREEEQVAALKVELDEAPNRKEARGITEEILMIYDKAKHRYFEDGVVT